MIWGIFYSKKEKPRILCARSFFEGSLRRDSQYLMRFFPLEKPNWLPI